MKIGRALIYIISVFPSVIALFNLSFSALGLSPGCLGESHVNDLCGAVLWFIACLALCLFIKGIKF